MAITILSGANLTDIVSAIITEDSTMLSKVKGVGKKTAERIILELKEKISGDILSGGSDLSFDLTNSLVNDTLMALVTLGLNKTDAMKRIKANLSDDDTVETLLEKILKNMSR